MTTLYIDFETASALDLKKSGASRYSRDPSLIVTIVGWAFGDEPAQAETVLTLGYKRLPVAVGRHIRSGGLVSGWNSRNFESNIIRNYFGLPLPPEQVIDTMQTALHCGLPAALGDAGFALGLSIVKDATAHRLMLQMARPRAIKPDGSCRWWHEDDADKLERLRLYCQQDVEAERAIAKAIPSMSNREKEVVLLDARANEKGVRVDVPVVRKMIAIADVTTKKLNAECATITNDAVTSPGSQTAKLLAWLGPHSTGELTKDAVVKALERDDIPPAARRVLKIRQLAAKSSVKKLQAVLSCVDDDDVIRGMLAYYGASRTGRWAGRLFQPQNLPRPSIKDPEFALDLIADGADDEALESLFGSPLEVISSCLRGILIPRPHHVFITFDLSQIEARMIAWLADQKDTLDVFASGQDVYTFTAEKLGLNSRQEGKVCIGEGTLVLTANGNKYIQDVLDSDLVWDGEGWVSHKGLLLNGIRPTIRIAGVWMTPDHLVLCGQTWVRAEHVVRNAKTLCLALATGSANLPYQASAWANGAGFFLSSFAARAVRRSMGLTFTIFGKGRAPVATNAPKMKAQAPGKSITATLVSFLTTSIARGYSIACLLASSGATTRGTATTGIMGVAGYTSTPLGVKRMAWGGLRQVGRTFWRMSSRLTAGMILHWNLTASTLIEGMSRAIFGSLLAAQTPGTNARSPIFRRVLLSWRERSIGSSRNLPVYDLASSGPNNRFTILTEQGPIIVHNCALGLGFGMGPKKFVATAETYGLTYTEEQAQKIVHNWRANNLNIARFWQACDAVVKDLLAQKVRPFTKEINKKVEAKVREADDGSTLLTLLLPSQRRLYYRNAMLADRIGDVEITYAGVDQTTRRWGLQRTYGGKLAENITQATARDVVVEMALEIERNKLGDVLLSVHDELIIEVPEAEAQQRYKAIEKVMNTTPAWAPGLPVKAEGNILKRYGK